MKPFRLPVILCAVAAWHGAIACALAADAPRGRPLEFSEPRSERVNSNATALAGRMTLLDQLEDDFNRPFKSIAPGNSLGGLLNASPQVMPPPVQPTQRARTGSKRDLWYSTPDELLPATTEDALKPPDLTPDGRRMKDVSPLERSLYKAAGSDAAVLTNRSGITGGLIPGSRDNGFPGSATLNGINPTIATPFNAGPSVPKPFGSDLDPLGSKIRQLQDFRDSQDMFGFGETLKPAKLTTSEQQRRDTFMKLYNPNYVAPVEGAAGASGAFTTPFGLDRSFYDPPKPAPVVSAPAIAPNPGAGSIASVAPAYTPPPPPLEAPKPKERTSPFMTIPRRDF